MRIFFSAYHYPLNFFLPYVWKDNLSPRTNQLQLAALLDDRTLVGVILPYEENDSLLFDRILAALLWLRRVYRGGRMYHRSSWT